MSDWAKLLRELRRQGFEPVLCRGGHYKVYLAGKLISTMPSSCGGGRGLRNAVGLLRRAGFEWKGQ